MTPKSASFCVWLALLILLAISVAVGLLQPVSLRAPLNFMIAVAMGLLVMMFYMRLNASSGLIRIYSAAGFFFLMLLFALSLSDYLSRG